MGRISPIQAEMYYNNSYANAYGPFLERPSRMFTDGAFAPMSPIQPTPVDQPQPGATFPGPRWWQYRTAWNLPTPPGTEGLKLASFDQLRTLAQKYSVARAAIEIRLEEIRGLRWEITLTTDAAKAYQGDRAAMRDFGERKQQVKKFFKRPDPDFWNFDSFLNAMLEEIFVYDALCLIFRPKFGASIGMGGRGLLGSDLDSLRLVSGPTIRPLIDLHGGKPAPPAPAYQQFLYGVPRSDYMTIARGDDLLQSGLDGAEVNEFNTDVMLYAPYWTTRESPYGFPPVERALLPIISGLQKQEFQLDYFTEGTIPAVYISPGDANITPTQIGELQNALNAIAGDPAYHMKVVVLPPGSKVEPQRPVDLSDSFDYLVMNQVCMAFDVQPEELGIIPNVGSTPQGPSASGIRFAGQETRGIKSRKSTLPMLQWICDIFNYVIQDICNQPDMQFQFEGLVDDEDKQAITQLGVEQVQNGIASIDEIRERLDMPPWGMTETAEPVVFTAQGPVPFRMAEQLIMAATQGAAGGNSTSSGQKDPKKAGSQRASKKKPTVRRGGQTRPNGSHPAPVAPHRENATPLQAASAGTIQGPTPRTGGTTNRTSVAGSRKKAATAELESLQRHLRKGKLISEWEPRHITNGTLARIAEDMAKGVLIDVAVKRASTFLDEPEEVKREAPEAPEPVIFKTMREWPGWEHDLGLVGRYKEIVSQAFQDAEIRSSQIRKDMATGKMSVSVATMHGLISDASRDIFAAAMTPLWAKSWNLGYEAGDALAKGTEMNYGGSELVTPDSPLENFLATEGQHWIDKVTRTGLGNSSSRSEVIARTEVARAMNAGALQAYKDNGISYKHLLVAPDDRKCEICKAAAAEGVIPLDAIFPGGGEGGPFHPNCRCVPAPAYIDVEPPLAHIGKNAAEDRSRLAWLLIRARDEDGKWRYLLQQRDDGSWGMPGGSTHVGEDPWDAAVRETTEEVGDLPPLKVVGTFHHMDDPETRVYVWACEVPFFHPKLNGSTPEETAGTAWFRKKEIPGLDLSGPFRDDWEEGHIDVSALKVLQNRVDETGNWLVMDDPDRHGAGLGSRWPYPQRGGQEWPDAGPGAVPGPSAGGEPPHEGPQDMADEEEARIYPRGSDDESYPRRRAKRPGASRFPSPETDGMWPQGGHADSPVDHAISVGAPKGGVRHASMYDLPVHGQGESLSGGPIPAETPRPYRPHSIPPVTMAPDGNEDTVGEEGDSPMHEILPVRNKGAQHVTDPNPVEWRHVYSQLQQNFPDDKLDWVKRARWIGPVNIPWDRIDHDDIDKWAASHEMKHVEEFVRAIRSGKGNTAPSILVQEPSSGKAFIVDGHHRALARRKLNMPVLAYVGNVSSSDRLAAEELHSSQIHQGNDPQNKGDSPKG